NRAARVVAASEPSSEASVTLRGLRVAAAGPRDLPERFARFLLGCVFEREIAERENAHQTLVAIHDRQTPNAQVPHVAGDLVDRLVLEAVLDLAAHDIPDARIRTAAFGHGANRDVA